MPASAPGWTRTVAVPLGAAEAAAGAGTGAGGAAGAGGAGGVDAAYLQRLLQLAAAFPPGVKFMLYAMEHFHDGNGHASHDASTSRKTALAVSPTKGARS